MSRFTAIIAGTRTGSQGRRNSYAPAHDRRQMVRRELANLPWAQDPAPVFTRKHLVKAVFAVLPAAVVIFILVGVL